MVAIIDYQAGNIASIQNMLKRIGADAIVTADSHRLSEASYLILPGVGAFDYGMAKLKELDLLPILQKRVMEDKVPILGICLGAQLMCNRSEEGILPGLGWIDADVKKFPTDADGNRYRVPHMGWETIARKKNSKLLQDLPDPSRFYFVHSYYINCREPEDKLLINQYGVNYDSAFERDNILGVQFHPEKSHNFGKQLLKNFIGL
ncbi:MAG: imidazole glycerol phosphate synthase subunit HisH [Cyclobacteriaceae bacterium]